MAIYYCYIWRDIKISFIHSFISNPNSSLLVPGTRERREGDCSYSLLAVMFTVRL